MWEHGLDMDDSKTLWKIINWKGETALEPSNDAPSDNDFKKHFEELLNPYGVNPLMPEEITTNVHIPVLDNLIAPQEVDEVIKTQLKTTKGCGTDGIAPGIFRILNHAFFFVKC